MSALQYAVSSLTNKRSQERVVGSEHKNHHAISLIRVRKTKVPVTVTPALELFKIASKINSAYRFFEKSLTLKRT